VARPIGPDAAPGGAALENSFAPSPSHDLRRGLEDDAATRLPILHFPISSFQFRVSIFEFRVSSLSWACPRPPGSKSPRGSACLP
jgi:hypothetical protein